MKKKKTIGRYVRRTLLFALLGVIVICLAVFYLGKYKASKTNYDNKYSDEFWNQLPGFIHSQDIFEEFYYNLDSLNVSKYYDKYPKYTVGDTIQTKGESYNYPDNFDILILRDNVAVKVRGKKISEIIVLDKYSYCSYPVINGRGFEIKVYSEDELKEFLSEYNANKEDSESEIFNKWMNFGTYRQVVFHDNYWVI